MSKRSYEDWLNRVDNIKAVKENFDLLEWAKVEEKRLEIIENEIDEHYKKLKKEYESALKDTMNEENYRNIIIRELKSIIENYNHYDVDIVADHKKLSKYYNADKLNLPGIEMPYPEFIKSEDNLNTIKAVANLRFYNYLINLQADEDETKGKTKNKITTKQQILLIYYLDKYQIMHLNKIHQDDTKQAKVINQFLNRNWDNVYEYLNEISKEKHKSTYFTHNNLKKLIPIFELIERYDIVKEINDEIEKIKSESDKF